MAGGAFLWSDGLTYVSAQTEYLLHVLVSLEVNLNPLKLPLCCMKLCALCCEAACVILSCSPETLELRKDAVVLLM